MFDPTVVAADLERGGDRRRAAAEALGLAIEHDSHAAALVELVNRAFPRRGTLPLVLGIVREALEAGHGMAYQRFDDKRGVTHCLVARWSDGDATWLTIGLSRAYGSVRIGAQWPMLAPWFKDLAKNRSVVEAWAKVPRSDTLRFEVTRLPTGAAPSGDPTAASLLEAIVAAPDDDAPRLVYADWLLERGDPYGELIALQCKRAAAPDQVTSEMNARIDALLASSLAAFAGDAAPYVTARDFERGFVDRVRMTFAAFAKDGERLFRSMPIRELSIRNPRFTSANLATLAATPALARVRSLALHQKLRNAEAVPLAALAESPWLGALENLELQFCGASAEDWRAFFSGLRAPRLQRIELFYNHSSTALFRAIGKNPSLAGLRVLDEYRLRDLEPEPPGALADAFEDLATLPALEELVLGRDDVDDAALAHFFGPGDGARLRRLTLTNSSVGDRSAELMAASPRAAELTRIHMHHTRIGPSAFEALLALRSLRELVVGSEDERWTPEAVDAVLRTLASLPETHPLRVVGVPRRERADPAVAALVERRLTLVR